ncbi:MAG TPA: Type 1 glutamine amidotransferase-like domain-containing protein [Patescibacteria group bacterium]|jgi:dipeptidase E|nr:Type 1 glutamine amidotransferase-like domain-containing protein [Patescibacteria group bacterium]
MRLYLSSFRNGNKPEELLKLIGDGRRTAVIFNAVDFKSKADRAADYAAEAERLKSIGLEPTEIDLRHYFGKSDELKKTLSNYDLIWVRGGNVFVLRRAFKQSCADTVIKELLANDTVAYGGYSAGVDILQPHLHGIELVDPPEVVPEDYDAEIIWECLDLLPYCVAPHYKSDHPESADVDKVVAYYIENHVPFIALHDGEAIVIEGTNQSVVG